MGTLRLHSSASAKAASPRWLVGLWLLAAVLTTWAFGYTSMLNSDLWFHLAAGRTIVEEGRVPEVDEWSFTAAGEEWHNHEWLSGVVFHLWSEAFGIGSLVYWEWGLLVAAFGLLFVALHRLTGSPAASWLAVLLAVAVAAPFFDVRPNLYSLAGVSLLLYLGLTRRRLPLALPLLFLVWTNLHGGAVLGLAVVGLLVAVRGWTRGGEEAAEGWTWRRGVGRDAAVAAGCAAACLVNPFGPAALLYPFELALAGGSASRRHIVEWASPFTPGGIQAPLYPWAIAAAAIGAVLLARRLRRQPERHPEWTVLAFAAATLAMSLQSRRFIVFFALATAYLVAPVLAGFAARAKPRLRLRLSAAAAVVVLVATGVRLAPYPWSPRAFPALTQLHLMPVAAVDFIEANGIEGKVFSYFLWGGYLHHRTAGGLKVFLDPRSETVFSDETQRLYYRVHFAAPGWASIVGRSGAELVLWPAYTDAFSAQLRQLVASGEWRVVHRGARAYLLARRGFALPADLRLPETAHQKLAEGRHAVLAGRLPAGEALLRQALEMDPTLEPACEDLVLVEAALGKREELLATARRCQRIFPDRARWQAHRQLAQTLPR
jgi:hypothetical protein